MNSRQPSVGTLHRSSLIALLVPRVARELSIEGPKGRRGRNTRSLIRLVVAPIHSCPVCGFEAAGMRYCAGSVVAPHKQRRCNPVPVISTNEEHVRSATFLTFLKTPETDPLPEKDVIGRPLDKTAQLKMLDNAASALIDTAHGVYSTAIDHLSVHVIVPQAIRKHKEEVAAGTNGQELAPREEEQGVDLTKLLDGSIAEVELRLIAQTQTLYRGTAHGNVDLDKEKIASFLDGVKIAEQMGKKRIGIEKAIDRIAKQFV